MRRQTKRRALLWVETSLWILGSICVSTYAHAQLTGVLTQRSAIESFRDRPANVDRSLWSESRIAHHDTTLLQEKDIGDCWFEDHDKLHTWGYLKESEPRC
jgi:hypothetical protein